jgi:hypothetical protein
MSGAFRSNTETNLGRPTNRSVLCSIRLDWLRRLVAVSMTAQAVACGSAIPEPGSAERPATDFVEVPYPPPPARVEFLPAKPRSGAVWIDGEWEWDGRRWAWRYGAWVAPPSGILYSRWTTIRRSDGTLLFAPSVFRNASGREMVSPPALATATAYDDNVVSPEGDRESTAPNIEADISESAVDGGNRQSR